MFLEDQFLTEMSDPVGKKSNASVISLSRLEQP